MGVKPGDYELRVDEQVLDALAVDAEPVRFSLAPTATGIGRSISRCASSRGFSRFGHLPEHFLELHESYGLTSDGTPASFSNDDVSAVNVSRS